MSIWKIRRPFRLLPALLAVCLLAGCGMADRRGQSAAQSVSSVSSESGTLAQPEDFLPQNLAYGERPPASDLEDAKGNAVSLTDAYSGVPVWIVFFASWCPDCDGQLDSASRMQRIADEEGARLVFIDRLSPDRESVNAAEKKLDEKGVTWSPSPSKESGKADLLIDRNETLYRRWGIKEIPTSVFLDTGDGHEEQDDDGGRVRGLRGERTEGRRLSGEYLPSRQTHDGLGRRDSGPDGDGEDIGYPFRSGCAFREPGTPDAVRYHGGRSG